MNSSNFVSEDESPGVDAILFGVTLAFISLIASLGNLLVLLAIYSNPSLRTMADCLLANLAVADLVQASVAVPLRMVNVLSQLLIPCHIVIFFTILSGGASNMAILLVSVDRLIAIKQSLRYYTMVTPNRVLISISFKWILLLIVAILPIAGWAKDPYESPSETCRFTETLHGDYVVMQSILLHVCPMLAVLLIYVVILKAACRHTKAIRAQEVCSQTRDSLTPPQPQPANHVSTTSQTFPSIRDQEVCSQTRDISTDPQQLQLTNPGSTTSQTLPSIRDQEVCSQTKDITTPQQLQLTNLAITTSQTLPPIRDQEVCSQTGGISTPQQLQLTNAVSTTSKTFPSSVNLQAPRVIRRSTSTPRQSRALRIVAIMVGVFIILVLPIIVIDVLEMWAGPVAPAGLVKVAICMIYTNSGVNVFIYAKSNTEYRRTFKRLLRSLWCRLKSSC